MPDQYHYYDGLTPGQALCMLAEVAAGPGKRYLAGARLCLSPGHRHLVRLNWPDLLAYSPRGEQKEREAASKAARETYWYVLGREKAESGVGSAPDSSLPIDEGVVWLLSLCKAGEEERPMPRDEVLVVGYDMDVDHATPLLDRLRLATSVRVASAQDEADRPCWFFWVKDDRGRGSLFSREDIDQTTLDGYACEVAGQERLVFLPEGFFPRESALLDFCRLVQAAPELFRGSDRRSEDHSLLAAIEQVPAEPDAAPITYRIWYLADLPFWDQVSFVPTVRGYADVRVCRLHGTPSALSDLVDRVRAHQRQWGYRLRLHPLTPDPGDREVDRLELQIAQMLDELEYWKILRKRRPRLLRFTDRQLPALADVMSRYPQDVIVQGEIQYAYQASDDCKYHPEGLHYLFIPADVTGKMIELDPLLLWAHADGPAMRFDLDPAWSREYFDRELVEVRHLVFVPEGTALFPSMHPWAEEGMDQYLRDCMGAWFHGFDVEDIPEHPLYIFDGTPEPGAEIHITVLNLGDFQPFNKRLEWMNDRLYPVHWRLRTETIRQNTGKIARDITTEAIATEVAGQARDTLVRYEKVARETKSRLEVTTAQLTQQITEGLRDVIDETAKKVKDTAGLRERLQVLQSILDQMDRALRAAQKAQQAAADDISHLEVARQKLERDTEAAIRGAKQALTQATARVEAEVESLVNRHRRLKRQIDDLLDQLQ